MTVWQARSMSVDDVEIFGTAGTSALREDLEAAGIAPETGTCVRAQPDGQLVAEPGARRSPRRASPRCRARSGPHRAGCPTTGAASSAAIVTARSTPPRGVAAGDAIAFPVKQGGLASQQAVAAAESIAARAGRTGSRSRSGRSSAACCSPGRGQAWMRKAPDSAEGEAERRALFWPPTKIAGRSTTITLTPNTMRTAAAT